MSSEHEQERRALLRETRQRIEGLRIAGIDRMPRPLDVASRGPRPKPVVRAPDPVQEVSISPPPPKTRPAPAAPAASLFQTEVEVGPSLPVEERLTILTELSAEVARCSMCPKLVASRSRTVFGEGSPTARLMFIGEGPGADEDASGRPFVGRAGQLLTDMITKGMGLKREDVYIANVVKCRPQDNREPEPQEARNCFPYLERQIAIIRPEFLCLLGRTAAVTLLDTALSVTRLRKRWHRYMNVPAIVTWHPAYLLRNPPAKRDTWEDLQMLMQAMGIKPPSK